MIRATLDEETDPKAQSFSFELDVLAELLERGFEAYLASPREESSDTPCYNHDVYILAGPNRKVPVSIKLGGKSSTKYRGGVRCVSKKQAERMGLWLHLVNEIPELPQDSHSPTLI